MAETEPKREISKNDYVRVVGLLTLAEYHVKMCEDIQRNIAEILRVSDEGGGYFGHVSDAIHEGHDAMTLIRKLEYSIAMPDGKSVDTE